MIVLVVALAVTTAHAGPALVESKPYRLPPADQLTPRDRFFIKDTQRYAEVAADATVELHRIRYRSGKLTVAGFLARPVPAKGARAKLPVVIWCRGGYGPDSTVGDGNVETLAELKRLAAAGFVVLMPNYRGHDGGDGVDERGGAEVEDVKALVKVARELAGADPARLFAYGESRGALDALIAIREGLPVTAVAVTGPVVDERTRSVNELPPPPGVDWTSAKARERRSPLAWAKELTLPVLILQGSTDRATPPEGALDLARALEQAGTVYELWIVAGGDHTLTRHRDQRMARLIDWFQHPRTQSVAVVVEKALDEGGVTLARTRFAAARKAKPGRYHLDEPDLNTLGYLLLARGRLDDAIAVFELNTQAFPASANVWDSLGEAHAVAGRREVALKHYRKALAIDPRSASARAAIARLEATAEQPPPKP